MRKSRKNRVERIPADAESVVDKHVLWDFDFEVFDQLANEGLWNEPPFFTTGEEEEIRDTIQASFCKERESR